MSEIAQNMKTQQLAEQLKGVLQFFPLFVVLRFVSESYFLKDIYGLTNSMKCGVVSWK